MGTPTVASLWFITPAWRRFALSAACFAQRRQVMDELAGHGIEAHCVVVADDENLELARAVGFDTVEQNNDWLGRRFNDGIEYACRHGADWIVPIGSDSWVIADYFAPLPRDVRAIQTGTYLATVTADRIAHLEVAPNRGGGPYMIHRSLLPPTLRPARDLIPRNTDRSLVDGLARRPRWSQRNLHRLQHVSFRGEPHLTSYDSLWYYWGVREERDPWDQLPERYPVELVQQAREALN